MSVTHYADADENGVTFIDPTTIAPVPPLCRQGSTDDLMTWFWDAVTCLDCLAAEPDRR